MQEEPAAGVARAAGGGTLRCPASNRVVAVRTPFGLCAVFKDSHGVVDRGFRAGRYGVACSARDARPADPLLLLDHYDPVCVTQVVPVSSQQAKTDPGAQEAIQREWQDNIVGRRVWDFEHPREWSDVARENPEAVVLRAHIILAIKHIEHRERMRWKSRVVVNGGDTRTVLGLLAEGADLYTCPLSLGTLRAIGAVSLLDDESELLGFDCEAAYTQGRR